MEEGYARQVIGLTTPGAELRRWYLRHYVPQRLPLRLLADCQYKHMRLTVNFRSVLNSTATMIRLSVEDGLSLVFSYLTINFDWYDAFQQTILDVL